MLRQAPYGNLIYVISDKTSETIARSFIRFQEYYENPIYKNSNGFTTDEIESWWTTKNTSKSYYEYWRGFNIPGRVILEVIKTSGFHPFNNNEIELLNVLNNIKLERLLYSYIIGVGDDTTDVLDHELAHAWFSTDPKYRMIQMYNISTIPTLVYSQLETTLKDMGYNNDVIHDEIQAYLSTYIDDLLETFPEIPNLIDITPSFVNTYLKQRSNPPV